MVLPSDQGSFIFVRRGCSKVIGNAGYIFVIRLSFAAVDIRCGSADLHFTGQTRYTPVVNVTSAS
jgi:hypothetical protein